MPDHDVGMVNRFWLFVCQPKVKFSSSVSRVTVLGSIPWPDFDLQFFVEPPSFASSNLAQGGYEW